MAAENLATSDYDAYADEYAASVAWRERAVAGGDAYGILPDLLELLGNIGSGEVLDAGCGEGYLARVLAVAINNPYGAVIRRHVADYFDSGAVSPYLGLWGAGIKAYYYHRTLEDYLDAFLTAGLRLAKLADIPAMASTHEPRTILPDDARFPRFLLLAFTKP